MGADDGAATEDGCAGINGDVIFNGGMAFLAAQALAGGSGARSEGDTVIHFYVVADDRRFAHYTAGAVIDEKMMADGRAGVEVHSGASVRPFRHNARKERHVFFVKHVGHSLYGDGFDEGIAHDNFLVALGGGIAIEGGLHIGAENFPNVGQFGEQMHRQRARGFAWIVLSRIGGWVMLDAFEQFIFEFARHCIHQQRGFHF